MSRADINEVDEKFQRYAEYLDGRSALGGLYRKYWLYPALNRQLRGEVLDIGCGIGDFLEYRGENTFGVDINPYLVDRCRSRGLDARQMDFNMIPFEERRFDGVVLDNVLEHISHPDRLLVEISRVLRPWGDFLLGVPGRRGYESDDDHRIFYDEQSLDDLLTSFGFTRRKIFYMPVKLPFLDRVMKQYCLYAVYRRA